MEIKEVEMLGLQKEIINRRRGKKSNPNEKFSCSFIANLLGKSYMAINKKLVRGNFTIEECFAIFETIVPLELRTIDMFKYLFTQQN